MFDIWRINHMRFKKMDKLLKTAPYGHPWFKNNTAEQEAFKKRYEELFDARAYKQFKKEKGIR